MTVTKQQQLEFAAMHIDKWKSGYDFAVIEKANDGQLCVRWPSICSGGVSKKEWQQERDKMSSKPEVDNSWHERGELPPIGCECEIKHKCWSEFQRVTVAAITKEYAIVEDDSVVAREQHYNLRDVTFRPLRTDREKAIDALIEIICANGFLAKDGTEARDIAERLYDAGMLK